MASSRYVDLILRIWAMAMMAKKFCKYKEGLILKRLPLLIEHKIDSSHGLIFPLGILSQKYYQIGEGLQLLKVIEN